MPSTYAHYRFGYQLIKQLPPEIQKLINDNLELYSIGLHGPDIYFYYNPLRSNSINQVGYSLHAIPATAFFKNSRTVIQEDSQPDAALAYILGFICHFSLDSTCHPYIEERIHSSGLSHTEIEVEYDSMLMRRDGLDPVVQPLTNHIHATMQNAKVIAKFFPVNATDTYKALGSMIHYNDLLIAPKKTKRFLIYALLLLTGNYKEMHGLIVQPTPNPRCEESNETLDKLYTQAMELACRLISDYVAQIDSDKPLDSAYKHTFGAE